MKMGPDKRHILIPFLFLGICLSSYAQNAPVTTCTTVAGAVPGTVAVPITVTGFANIGAVSLSIDYDYAVARFINGVPNPAMPTLLSGDMDLGNGSHRISLGWYGNISALPDGSTIITLNFNYIGGNTPLTWFENGSSCEYATPTGTELNDVPADSFYISGYLCGATGNPGPVSGNVSVCQGQQGEIYSVDPLPNVTGYDWTLPEGAVIINGENSNSITVDYLESAVSGTISVHAFNPCGSGPASELPVTVNSVPSANAGNDTTINYGTSTMLHAAPGGPGNCTYHWSPEEFLVDPDVQHPQTLILTMTTVFSVVVTNPAGSCQAADEMIVTITGGPLSANPAAMPGGICAGGYSQLYSNAGGGSGNYTYQWTCLPPGNPPWMSTLPNPVVYPDSSRLYFLEVFDGFTEITASAGLTVSPLPAATISGGDTLCGPGNITILPVELTGTPPWSFIYTNGITSVFVNGQETSPYYILTGDPGTYTIIDLEDANCSGNSFGTATVGVFPVPETPEITVIEDNLASGVCCGNQWYLNGDPVPGATGQVLHVTENGWYFDIVTINGCQSDTSEIIDMIVGINELQSLNFILSPNPAHSRFNIIYTDTAGEITRLMITSTTGITVREQRLYSSSSINKESIDIHDLTPGLYFVTVLTGRSVAARKLVIL